MTIPMVHARPSRLGRSILRRVFDAAHARPRPHFTREMRPRGPESLGQTG